VTGILIIVGLCVAFVGHLLVLNSAFKTSLGWGLASLFLPFGVFVYVAKHWDETRRAFLCWAGGFAVMLLAFALSPSRPRPEATADRKDERTVRVSSAAALPPREAEPQPVQYVPPPPEPLAPVAADDAATAPAAPKLQQVYIDRASKLYYRESCTRRPQTATRVAKSVALMQGYREARCD